MQCVKWNSDGKSLATASKDGVVGLLNFNTEKFTEIYKTQQEDSEGEKKFAFDCPF